MLNIVRNRVFDCHRRPTGDKWQSKTLFLAIFDPRSSIIKSVFDCSLSGVGMLINIRLTRVSGDDLYKHLCLFSNPVDLFSVYHAIVCL